jgi:hypothetical protein
MNMSEYLRELALEDIEEDEEGNSKAKLETTANAD